MNTVTVTAPSGNQYNFLFGSWSKRRFMELCKDFEAFRQDQFTMGQLSLDMTFAVIASGLENYRKCNGEPTVTVTPFDASMVVDDLGGENSDLLEPVLKAFNFFNNEPGEQKEEQPPKKAKTAPKQTRKGK